MEFTNIPPRIEAGQWIDRANLAAVDVIGGIMAFLERHALARAGQSRGGQDTER